MGFILKLLAGALGPWITGGVVVAIALGLVTSCFNGKRAERLERNLSKETARADLNYQRALDWRDVVLGPKGWKAAYAKLDLRRRQETADTARLIRLAEASRARASTSAFNMGYAAGRAASPRGTTNAQPSPDRPAEPSRVRDVAPSDDLANVFREGAYRFAARLSGGP